LEKEKEQLEEHIEALSREYSAQILSHFEKTNEATSQFQQQVDMLTQHTRDLRQENEQQKQTIAHLEQEKSELKGQIDNLTLVISSHEEQIRQTINEHQPTHSLLEQKHELDKQEWTTTNKALEETINLLKVKIDDMHAELILHTHFKSDNDGTGSANGASKFSESIKLKAEIRAKEQAFLEIITDLKILLGENKGGGTLVKNKAVGERLPALEQLESMRSSVKEMQMQLFNYMALALKYDALQTGYTCNFDVNTLYDEVLQMRLPRTKWGGFIRQKIVAVSKKANKKRFSVSFSPVVQRILIGTDGTEVGKDRAEIRKEKGKEKGQDRTGGEGRRKEGGKDLLHRFHEMIVLGKQ